MGQPMPEHANILDAITQQQVLVAVGAALLLAIIVGGLNYRKRADIPHAIGLSAHITVWQASSGANMLFWYILGSSMDAVSAILLPVIFFVGDIAKILIPRTRNYRKDWGKRLGVNLLRAISIFATVGLGSLYFEQNANSNLDANLARQQAKALVDAANAGKAAAVANAQSEAPDMERLAATEQLRQQIDAIKSRPAVTRKGNKLYWQGKSNSPTPVWVATDGCKPGSSYTKVPANGCEELNQLLVKLVKLEGDLTNQPKKLVNQRNAFQDASTSLEDARRVLAEAPPTLPVNDMIAALLSALGVDPDEAASNERNAMIFGIFLAIALELLVMITLGLDFTAPPDDEDQTNEAGIFSLEKMGEAAIWLFRTIRNPLFSGVKRGLDPGQIGVKNDDILVKPAEVLTRTQEDAVETFRNINLETLSGIVGTSTPGISLKDGHNLVLILLMQRYAGNVATSQFFKTIKAEYGEGIRKAYIDEAKAILHYNGYMNAVPFGQRGIKYEWVDEATLRTIMQQHLDGSYRYQPATPVHERTHKAPIVTIEALRQRKNQMNFNPDGLSAA